MTVSGAGDMPAQPCPFAVILGTNETASAIAVHLHRAGYAVVLSHDPHPPVIRRKMAFHDALFDDGVAVDGVAAWRADTGIEIRAALARGPCVMVTELGLLDLIVIRRIDGLVDARLQKYRATPDLRRLAARTVGLGPGFSAGVNCDVAVETRPGKAGRVATQGYTDAPDGVTWNLGGHREDRFVRAAFAGRWHSAVEIGTRVFKDFIIGHLGRAPVRAPFDGILRGAVRDGTEVSQGVKLIEIDARGRRACWTGVDPRGRRIAAAVARALRHEQPTPPRTPRTLYLVK